MNPSIAAVRGQLFEVAVRRCGVRRRRRRLALATLSMLLVAGFTGITLAATGLLGSAAPPEVIEDFEAYTEQLGYHPQPGRAQLVAKDGDFLLYATTNREGTYCIVTSAPWRRPGRLTGDGGVCVPANKAAEPIAVGVTAGSAVGESREMTLVVAGRVRDQRARTIQFSDAGGEPIERLLGAQGFFVAGVRHTCTGDSWSPTFTAADSAGNPVAMAKITLAYVDARRARANTCGGFEVTPHGPYPFDRQPN